MDALTDFESHRIEGYLPDGRNISVPLISPIYENLWMGGCIGGVRLGEDFRHVVSLYPWERYELALGTLYHGVEMYDHGDMPDPAQLEDVVDRVVSATARGQTLVHCQAGLNRSGLVSALALMRGGASARAAIGLLRLKRSPLVLCNQAFENYLLGL